MKNILSQALFGALFLWAEAASAQTPNSVPLSPAQIQAATNTAIAPNLPGGITALSLNSIINQFDPFTNLWFDASGAQNGLVNKWNGTAWVPLVIQQGNGGVGATTASANTILAGPTTGSAAAPTFRPIVPADLSVTCPTTQVFYNNAGAVACGTISETFTGGLISVAGSPAGATGAFALTVAGTSGGIPYFSSGTAWASSAALAANQIVLGGGAGAAPSTSVGLGTVTQVLHGNASGPPAFTAIAAADITAALAAALPAPPPIGGTTPNTGAFTTLFGTTMGIGTSALVGDGVTSNNVTLQAALTAIASGGEIYIPCGTYKITTGMTLAVTAGKHVLVKGAGAECVTLFVSGAGLTGLTFNYGSATSSVSLRDLTITTDQVGGTAAIKLALATAGAGSNAAVNDITNVTVRGSDGFGATNYWSTGFIQSNVSNVNLSGYNYWGGTCVSNLCNGVGASLAGSSGISSYAVATNVVNSSFNNCSQGIFYGDWYQGLQVANSNFTGCQHGIIEVGAHSGVLGEMSVVNSQFSTYADSISFNTSIAGINLSNNYFIIQPSTTAVILTLTVDFAITGNTFSGINTTAVGISFGGVTSGGTITGNTFSTLSVGVSATGNQNGLTITGNHFTTVTANFSWSSVTNVVFDDLTQFTVANLNSTEACSSGIKGSRASISDAAASPVYLATATGGGSIPLKVMCNGTNWVNE